MQRHNGKNPLRVSAQRDIGSQLTILVEFMQYRLIQAVRAGQFAPRITILAAVQPGAGTDSTM
jgi:hypothetical protein